MTKMGKIWFSIRVPITCHLYEDCTYADRIKSENEATVLVEVNRQGIPIDLPPTAMICQECENKLVMQKSYKRAYKLRRWFIEKFH